MITENPNCDGAGPHLSGQVRVYPAGGGGNFILCRLCWFAENRYAEERGRETGQPQNWPEQSWPDARIYESGS